MAGRGDRRTSLQVRRSGLGWSPSPGAAPRLGGRALAAEAVADRGAGAVVAVRAGRPEVGRVVAAAEDHWDDVVDGGGVAAAAPAGATVACEGGGAQLAPA